MKTKYFITIISILMFLLPIAVQAQANKTVSVPSDALYTGTYNYLGTRNGYPYYKHSTQNLYLYVDNYLGAYGNIWMLANALVTNPGSEVKYYQWPDSYPTIGDPGATQWYDVTTNCDGGNCPQSIIIVDEVSGVAPTVSTSDPSLVTTTSGTMNGNIVADGGATTNRGFIYSSSDNTPTLVEVNGTTVFQVTSGSGTGVFSQMIGSLTSGQTYYYQAYGTNTYGTTHGGIKSFTTLTSGQPNKYLSGVTTPAAANGVYVWIGNYYNKPAWKHQSLNYWIYYSVYKPSPPWDDDYYWYIDDELKNDHGANDYFFDHTDAATCPSSGWAVDWGTGVGTPSVVDYPNITFTNGASYDPGNPAANTNNNPVGRFLLSGELSGASLTAATITVSGTRTNVSNLKIWSSSDNSFNAGSDTQLNSQSDGASVTFSGFSSSISTSGTYYFITADLGTSSSGTISLSIGSQSNLTISGGAIASGFSNAALTSGTLTIITPPSISTTAVSIIGANSATLGGNVTASGGATVSARGVVYSITSVNANPEIGGTGVTQAANGSGTGTFSASIGSLSPTTGYSVQAYATNSVGTSYGGVETFTTDNVTITFTNGANAGLTFVQTNALPGTTNWLCGQFSLAGSGTGATLNSVTVALDGTYDSGDLQSTPFQLYASNTNEFEGGGTSAIGTSVADPGSGHDVTFSSLSDAIPASTRYYWVTADISATATADDNMNGTIGAAGNLSISSGTLSGSSSYGKLNAGSDASLPVSLVSFSVRAEGRSVILEWITESETDNLGFILERSVGADSNPPGAGGTGWQTIASYQTHTELKGQGNTSSRTEYSFADKTVEAGKTYAYRLSDVSTKGEITAYASLSVKMDNLPETTEMEKAYPNPFNPQTFIGYKLAEDTDVNITVFDMLGRQVRTLFSGHQFAGSYNVYWNATDETGSKVPSGGYIIQMKTEKTRQTQKVMLMK